MKTDDIEKSNFNPQMLKSCTDTSYECGYQQGRADAIEECMQIVKDYSSALVGTYYYNLFIDKMEQLKNLDSEKEYYI